jgi:hypothetical protein
MNFLKKLMLVPVALGLVTPALFYVDNNQRYQDSSKWGGVIQTKFTF